MKKVYLAGPITGLSWEKSEGWRDMLTAMVNGITHKSAQSEVWREKIKKFARNVNFEGIQFYSPLRGKDYLRGEQSIADSYTQHKLSTSRTIMLRDHHDVTTADALIVNLMGAQRVSIGTVMELAWAYDRRIPVIAIMEDAVTQTTGFDQSIGPNIHEHSMLDQAIWYRVQSIEEALGVLLNVLKP